jgi:hypothetical protein
MRNEAQYPQLSYLDASKVTSPAGRLSDLDLLTADGTSVGSIQGVVIDAPARRVRYFEVQLSGWFRRQRYFLEADQLAQIEPGRKALRLCGDIRGRQVRDLDADTLHAFSDDDLLAALFPPRASSSQ